MELILLAKNFFIFIHEFCFSEILMNYLSQKSDVLSLAALSAPTHKPFQIWVDNSNATAVPKGETQQLRWVLQGEMRKTLSFRVHNVVWNVNTKQETPLTGPPLNFWICNDRIVPCLWSPYSPHPRDISSLHPNSSVLHTPLVDVNRTSELRRSLAGGVGVSPPPIIDWSLKPYVSPVVLS